MRWSPYIIGPWVARVRPTMPDAPSQGRMKWNEMDEMSVEKWWNEICGWGKREKPREKPTLTSFRPPRNPHGVTKTRTRDPSGGRRAANRMRHEAAYCTIILPFFADISWIQNTWSIVDLLRLKPHWWSPIISTTPSSSIIISLRAPMDIGL